MNGRLLVFEGIDGAGKSTQLKWLADDLKSQGKPVLCTSEPYEGCPAGRRIRKLARAGTLLEPEAELALFVEQRRAHVDEVIKPGLERGDWVLSDRYYFSSVAYQGARGLPWRKILADHEEGDFPRPDMILQLDLPARWALERVHGRRDPGEAYENEEFLTRVREIYREIWVNGMNRIDATRSAFKTAALISQGVRDRYFPFRPHDS